MDVIRLTLLAGVVCLSLLLLLRILPMLRFFLLIIMAVLLVVVLVYYFNQDLQVKKTEKAFLKTTAGQISVHLKFCEEQQVKLAQEQASIQQSLVELKQNLQRATGLPAAVVQKTQNLIKGFEQEKQLRQTKIHFFQQCTDKLKLLLDQHQLLQTLEEKKQELERYQDQHYDDLAKMESLRWEVEQEAVHLETLQDLSTRMQNSTAMDDVLHLQHELDKMLAS
jgi:hypothetical protein